MSAAVSVLVERAASQLASVARLGVLLSDWKFSHLNDGSHEGHRRAVSALRDEHKVFPMPAAMQACDAGDEPAAVKAALEAQAREAYAAYLVVTHEALSLALRDPAVAASLVLQASADLGSPLLTNLHGQLLMKFANPLLDQVAVFSDPESAKLLLARIQTDWPEARVIRAVDFLQARFAVVEATLNELPADVVLSARQATQVAPLAMDAEPDGLLETPKPNSAYPAMEVEVMIVRQAVQDLMAAGFWLSVGDGNTDGWRHSPSQSSNAVLDDCFHDGETFLYAHAGADAPAAGYLYFIHGNGHEVLSDCTSNLSPVLGNMQALIERLTRLCDPDDSLPTPSAEASYV